MDWQALLKDKRVWAGAAGAAGLGLVAYIRKLKTTPATGQNSSGGTAATTAASSGTGNADTTGTDIASFLSNYSGSLQGQLNDYGKQLTDTLSALQTGGITTPTAGTGTPPTSPIYATVLPGWHIDQWINDIQAGKGPAGSSGLTFDQLEALNPTLNQDITWRAGTAQDPGTRNNVFSTKIPASGLKLRVA